MSVVALPLRGRPSGLACFPAPGAWPFPAAKPRSQTVPHAGPNAARPTSRPPFPPRWGKKGDATRIGESCPLHPCCSWVATSFFFFGRPSGRNVASKPIVRAVCCCHGSVPYGLPRFTDRRMPANSASVCASFTNSVQSPGRGRGHGCNRLSPRASPLARRYRLDHRHCSARSTNWARSRSALHIAQHRQGKSSRVPFSRPAAPPYPRAILLGPHTRELRPSGRWRQAPTTR